MLNKSFLALVVATAFSSGAQRAQAIDTQGPSSSQSPYLVSTQPNVEMRSILTVGDQVGVKADGSPYRMVGIPDGLGAYDNYDGTFTVLMNHELGATSGAVRAHGSVGAFISRLVIRKSDLGVVSAGDLIQQVATFNVATGTFNAPAKGVTFNRFCSADLPDATAFYDPISQLGFFGRLFMNGEESGPEGRAFAHTLTGTTYELPRLGKFSWENSLAHPYTGTKTVVAGTDDGRPGEVYIYVGQKQSTGSPVDQAGLTNGVLYGVKVEGFPLEPQSGIPANTRFSLAPLGDVSSVSGAGLQTLSTTAGVTQFLRPEDGAWDPANRNDFYFQTTNAFNLPSRLWRLRFDNASNPEAGGRIEAVLDGTEGQQMLDNLTISLNGRAILQEDPGGNEYLAKLRQYNIATDTATIIAQHDPTRFLTGGSRFLTNDEESSGVVDMSEILGPGMYLLDVQAHYLIPGELVEGGQLLAMKITDPPVAPPTMPPVFTPGLPVIPVTPPVVAPPVVTPPVVTPPAKPTPPKKTPTPAPRRGSGRGRFFN